MRQSCCHCLTLPYSSRERLNDKTRQLFRIPNCTTLRGCLQPRRIGIAARWKKAIDESKTLQKTPCIHSLTCRPFTLLMFGILRVLSRFSTAQEVDKSTGTIELTLSIARGMFHFFVHIFPKLVPGFSQLLIYRSHDSPLSRNHGKGWSKWSPARPQGVRTPRRTGQVR